MKTSRFRKYGPRLHDSTARFASKPIRGYFEIVMERTGSDGQDFAGEARLFFKIQTRRYLSSRPRRRFSCLGEKDAVNHMIRDAWVELRSGGRLDGLSPEGRKAVYWTTIIVFPGFVADAGESCIAVDFGRKVSLGRSRPKAEG